MTRARTRFAPDQGLSRRMGLTVVLLGVVYVGGVALIVAKAGLSTLPLVLVLAIGFLAIQWFASDRIALFGIGGHVVTQQQQPDLHATVDRLCALADMTKPRIAVADIDMPNAFATGRNEQRAVLCVTSGLMRRLDRDELEGVLAHELSHIAHRDVAVMTIASFLGILAGLLTRSVLLFGGGRRGNNGASPVMIVLVVSIAVYALSFLLIRALSRYREFAADRSGAQLTGRPSQLASALVKISGEMGRIPTRDLRRAEPFNAFYFAPAFSKGRSSALVTIFSTHPSTEARVAALTRVALELGV